MGFLARFWFVSQYIVCLFVSLLYLRKVHKKQQKSDENKNKKQMHESHESHANRLI